MKTSSETLIAEADDRIEYTEIAALCKYVDVVNGDKTGGLAQDELRVVV